MLAAQIAACRLCTVQTCGQPKLLPADCGHVVLSTDDLQHVQARCRLADSSSCCLQTVGMSFSVGTICSMYKPMVVLEALVLTAAIVSGQSSTQQPCI